MKSFTLICCVCVLSACATVEAPPEQGPKYFCKADSAVRYRGEKLPRTGSARPAPAHGSCRVR